MIMLVQTLIEIGTEIIVHQSRINKDLGCYAIGRQCVTRLGKKFFSVQIHSEGLHKNYLAKLLKTGFLYSETSSDSYNIFSLTLTHLKSLQRLGFLCNWPAVRYWTWQILFLSSNSFRGLHKNSPAKLLKTGSLCSENSG